MKKSLSFHFWFGSLLSLVFLALCSIAGVNAQINLWTFVYNESFPSPHWGCATCSDVATSGSQPQTKIAYARNGFTGPVVIDRNLMASFNGGRMLGGIYETGTCEYGGVRNVRSIT